MAISFAARPNADLGSCAMTYEIKKAKALMDLCSKFIDDNEIGCEEIIYQTDIIDDNVYYLVESICELIGYHLD